jgi:DNA invertase Pin-like site-specific DNA recombinase
MPKTYGYGRVSTEEQVLGCDVQTDLISETAKKLELPVSEYIMDDGVSTSKVPFNKRPGIIHLLEILRPGDHLIVWRLDRLERGFFTFYSAISQIVSRDVWIHSIEERGGLSLDLSTAAGRAMLAIWQIAGDMYRETVQENTKCSARYHKKNGMAWGRIPLGKMRIIEGKKKFDVWDNHQLDLIREIVSRHNNHESYISIAKDFIARGERDQRGNLWGQPNFDKQHARRKLGNKNIRVGMYRFAYKWYHRLAKSGELPAIGREKEYKTGRPKAVPFTPRNTALSHEELEALCMATTAEQHATAAPSGEPPCP